MIKITDYIHCYENVLDKNVCKAIIDNSKDSNFLELKLELNLEPTNLANIELVIQITWIKNLIKMFTMPLVQY